MKHFGIFNTSGEVETAISQSAITEPYVVMVSGDVYYNTVGETGMTGCWVEDSDGNTYSGTLESNYYGFNFYKPTGATWTLYYNGQVVTASSFHAEKRFYCEQDHPGGVDIAEVVQETGYTVEGINIGTGDGWAVSAVNIHLSFVPSSMEVSCGLDGEDCQDYDECRGYEEGTQEKCVCEGRYWWGDECHDEPEAPCAGMEGEIADCEGRGGVWDYANCRCNEPPSESEPDPCGGDPECECYQQGPDWSWNGEECIYNEPESEPSE